MLTTMEQEVEESKRASYTNMNEDVLHNFKRDALQAGITPMQNWLTHFLKQVAAVVSYVRFPEVKPSEPLVSRLGDIRTYCKLLLALAEDSGQSHGLPNLGWIKFTTPDVGWAHTEPGKMKLTPLSPAAGSSNETNPTSEEIDWVTELRATQPPVTEWPKESCTLDPRDNPLDPRYNPRSKTPWGNWKATSRNMDITE
jgi:hypothetical protein